MASDTILEKLIASSSLHWSDYIVLAVYFLLVIGFGIWSSCFNRGSVKGYFLAGRNMHWILVGASLFASNIGSGHFVGLAGTGASSGLAVGIFEIHAVYSLVLLGWVFVPVYVTSGVYTMPEYLKKRFGGERIQLYLATLSVILYVFTKISADLFAGAVFIKQSIGWDIWGSIIALLTLAMLFTIAGGLSAVIWTDFIQVIIMLIGATMLMILSFIEIGGYSAVEKSFTSPKAWSNFTNEYLYSVNNGINLTERQAKYGLCGKTPDDSFHLMRPPTDPELPWTGLVIGLATVSIWYWCSDQVIVQRALAAKNMIHVKSGCVFAGLLKLSPLFLMVIPGMISRILYPDLVGCSEPDSCEKICGNRAGCTNIAYPLLVVKLMPHGARGLMLAVMMSALMSSLTSIFNSSSTIFTMDIWRKIRKSATQIELMIVGRLFVIVLVALSIAWVPIINNVSELFHYIQAMQAFLAPPVCSVFVLAVLWKRTNEQGAFWGLMVGLVVGMIRFIWEYSYGAAPPCGEEDLRHFLISRVHYLHFGIFLFIIVCIVTIIISLLTKPINSKHLVRLTFFSRHEEGDRVEFDEEEGTAPNSEIEMRDNIAPNGEIKMHENITSSDGDTIVQERTTTDIEMNERTTSKDGVEMGGVSEPEASNINGKCEREIVMERTAWYKKAAYWICGIESMRGAEAEAIETVNMNIDEDIKWKRVVNLSSLLVMIGTAFLWGVYA